MLGFLAIVGLIFVDTAGVVQATNGSWPWPPWTPSPASPGPIALTNNGLVEGLLKGTTSVWLGIPFAEPPVADRRLRAPVAVERIWQDVLRTDTPAEKCIQPGLGSQKFVGSEDCLYLNVFAPANNIGPPRPVMVWIHGGGFSIGNGYGDNGEYDGSALSERHELVVVSMNYRLGALGFFALDALKDEDPSHSTGNYGTQDQQLALRWVHENIRNFGGDPGRVTLFGESAGAMSVLWHTVSPMSKGLFHGAIAQSPTTELTWFFQPYAAATSYYKWLAAHLGCNESIGHQSQLECLRSQPKEHFMWSMEEALHIAKERNNGNTEELPDVHSPLWPLMPSGPVIDGSPYGLQGNPVHMVKNGNFNRVPLLVGANEDGGSMFLGFLPIIVTGLKIPATWQHNATRMFLSYVTGGNETMISQVLSEYPVEEYQSDWLHADRQISRIIRDLLFQCANRAITQAWRDTATPSWLYQFNFDFGLLGKLTRLGDAHGAEIPFVFRNFLGLINWFGPLFSAYAMADIITCKWASFAYTLDPSGGSLEANWPPNCREVNRGLPEWPSLTEDEAFYYELKVHPEVHEVSNNGTFPNDLFPRSSKCDLWDSLAWKMPFVNETKHQGKASSNTPSGPVEISSLFA